MDEEQVCDLTEAFDGVLVRRCHRFFGEIAARTHDGPSDTVHQHVVKWRVRQHYSQVRVCRRNGRGNVADSVIIVTDSEKQDRGLRTLQRVGFGVAELTPFPDLLQRGHHQRQRLAVATLSVSKTSDGFVVRRIHEKLKSAKPFDGNNVAIRDSRCGRSKCRIGNLQRTPQYIEQLQFWAARRTSDRLGVESPVGWILILLPTIGTHLEGPHRGVGTIVRQLLDDRPPGTAVRAVRKGGNDIVARPP